MKTEYLTLCEKYNESPIIENDKYDLAHFDKLKQKEYFHPIVPVLIN